MKISTLTLTTLVALTTMTSAFAVDHTKAHTQKDSKMMMDMMQTSSMFKGVEVNKGTVSFSVQMGKPTLMLSSDFMIPNSPAPSWQIVDGKGNTFLFNQLKIAGDKTNRKLVIPSYIQSVSKVQIWCSFAEVNLGEAMFAKPIMIKK
ncbi:MAG: hypothetical protein K8R88_02280 [Armatimonadetes bacterium]|nr:hypothetical protein [Armatimonadota bacterium]